MIRIDLQISKEGAGLPKGSLKLIENELYERIHRRWPDAFIRVRRGSNTNLAISGSTKGEKESLSKVIEEMFEEAADWLYV